MAKTKPTAKSAPSKPKAAAAPPPPKAAPPAAPKTTAPAAGGGGLKGKIEHVADEARADLGKVGGKLRGEIKSLKKKK